MTFIGFSTSILPNEVYVKCPEFWDNEYSRKYAKLWQTMKPETPIEKAILENQIGNIKILIVTFYFSFEKVFLRVSFKNHVFLVILITTPPATGRCIFLQKFIIEHKITH